jgi:hypothetical protein
LNASTIRIGKSDGASRVTKPGMLLDSLNYAA